MNTDRAFGEIFEQRPDWLGALTGAPIPQPKSARPRVFKPKIECDLAVEPASPGDPWWIVEFQFYYDASIYVRAELARLLLWRQLNPVKQCRRRSFRPRPAVWRLHAAGVSLGIIASALELQETEVRRILTEAE